MSQRLSCEQVAERYGVKLSTVWKWIREKELPAYKFGRSYTVDPSDLPKFEESRMTVPAHESAEKGGAHNEEI